MHAVVVAEDEPLIRMMVAQLLVEEGFLVWEAEHAAKAIAILEVEARSIHLLFTDIRMPGDMDGLALSHHVKVHWPWIGLLVTSAHASIPERELPRGGRFLLKPYRFNHLVSHLRELGEAA